MNYSTRFKTVLSIVYLILALCFIGLPFSFLAFGSDLNTAPNPGYPYNSMVYLQEDFMTGSTASGSIGATGWGAANGTTSLLTAETNRPGIMRRDSSAVSGTVATAIWSIINPALDVTNSTFRLRLISRLNTNDANTTVRQGFSNGFGASPPSSGIYFEKLDADTNWFCVLRSGGVQTRTDSGVSVSTNFDTFLIISSSASVTFLINNTPTSCGSMTSNFPAVDLSAGLHIVNSAAASKTIDVDYSELMIKVAR